MSEIEKKATQIAQESVINAQPFDFASIEYGAIKMGYWMIQRFYKHLVERCFFTEEEAKEVCKAMEE